MPPPTIATLKPGLGFDGMGTTTTAFTGKQQCSAVYRCYQPPGPQMGIDDVGAVLYRNREVTASQARSAAHGAYYGVSIRPVWIRGILGSPDEREPWSFTSEL